MPGLATLKALRGATKVLPPQQTIKVETVPPPVGGWNRRDTLPLMEVTDAITLENWIPDTNAVRLRGGFATHAVIDATATAVETLVKYAPPNTANNQLFAATPTTIYNVTAAATASSTSAVVTSTSNGRWQSSQMTNTAGSHLILVNGADQPRMYDGTTWATCSVSASGLTRTNLIGVHNHQNRLWFLEENQNFVWYLDTSAIQGVLTKFLLPFRKGGKLMAMGSWTRDGGAGPDDLAVFVSSRGECVIYSGTDPASSNTFGLVGIYNIPDVIGRRCLIPAGAELCILTMQGLVPLSQILGMSEGAAARTSFNDKISGYFREQFFATGTSFGWQPIEYPRGNLLIVNIPITEREEQHQAVMNINTGAWCKFTAINAGCWAVLGDDIYFGGNGSVVYKFDSGTSDNGENIVGILQHAYSIFGSPQTKRFTMARPLFLAPVDYHPPVAVQVDYDENTPAVVTVEAGSVGTQWDAGLWDTFQWAGGASPSLRWQSVAGEGRAGSIAFGVASGETITYNGVDVGFERGNWL
jgi:hypothetical protein